MYEASVIIKNLMQFLQPKMHRGRNAIMFFYFPSPPPLRTQFMYNVNNNL